jgi:hypothetical protein
MSTTVGMVPVYRRPRQKAYQASSCTACGAPLVEAIAVINGKVRKDALACWTCGRLGVHCACERV